MRAAVEVQPGQGGERRYPVFRCFEHRECFVDMAARTHVTLLKFGIGQLKEHVTARGRRRRLGQRPREQPRRRAGVAPLQRLRGGLAQGSHRPLVAFWPGEKRMGGDRIERCTVSGEQVLGPAVGARPGECGNVRVDARADQRMGEAQRLARRQDASVGQRVGRCLRSLGVQPGQQPSVAQRHPVPQHRHRLGQLSGGIAAPVQADKHRAQNRVGHQ